MKKLDFEKKGMVSVKYLADGCEFKKQNDKYKLVSTAKDKYQPFIGQIHSESIWDLISKSSITSGARYNEFYSLLLDHFKSGHTLFTGEVNLLLKKGEIVVYKSFNNIVLKEPKSVRVSNSVHAGTSHRRGKRSFGYGATKSVSESKEVVKQIDVGQIIITNKRFIFTGAKRNVDVNISQITGITPYSDAFILHRKNKQKPEYFMNVNDHAFISNWDNETFFFFMNGQMIKSLIEGGLNKTPEVSKLQKLTAQKQLESKKDNNTQVKANFCPNCGMKIEHDGNFCQNCGEKIK